MVNLASPPRSSSASWRVAFFSIMACCIEFAQICQDAGSDWHSCWRRELIKLLVAFLVV
jgi:hypothetical protein